MRSGETDEMSRAAVVCAVYLLFPGCAWSLPTVDGSVRPGEYGRSISLLDGAVTVSWQTDASGGLFVAVSAATTGWVGLGLGSVVMDGAHIFMGSVRNGTPVFSEQVGAGHSHSASPTRFADRCAVGEHDGTTTLEFHVPADKVPRDGMKVDFIVAYSGSADLTTFHEDNHDGGVMDLSSDD
jgi:hypothetical protein